MKKKIIFNPKPPSKAEQIYLELLRNRPNNTVFNEIYSKAHESHYVHDKKGGKL